jgi:hypothetical protein
VTRFDADRAPYLLDLAVFAPLGLVATAGTEVPAAVERTRKRVHERIVLARFIGELVVRQAGVEVERRIAARRAGPVVAPPTTPATPATAAPPADALVADEIGAATPRPDAVAAEGLPIEGYDSLPASHVIALLDGLGPTELAAVEAYERHHRRRRTVLGRIEQLRS